jgi:hypothetical protein
VSGASRIGGPDKTRSLECFHVLVSPPGETLMAAIKADLRVYTEDSGDEPDPQHKVIALASYLSELDRWKVFEREWREVLGDNHVPYLHMKEWWNEDRPIYKHLKSEPKKQETFFRDLAGVIKRNIRFCATSTVRLGDLRKFNDDHGLKIRAYSLALYGCIIELRNEVKDDNLSIIIDHISKPQRAIELAETYAKTDTWADLKVGKISIAPLKKEKNENCKTVLPMQAGDWMSWELRKNATERISWEITTDDTKTQVTLYRAYAEWKKKFTATHGREPRDRKSAWALYKATPQSGILWDYQTLLGAHVNRHKSGWR